MIGYSRPGKVMQSPLTTLPTGWQIGPRQSGPHESRNSTANAQRRARSEKEGFAQGHRIKIGGLGRMANSAFGGKLNLCGTWSHLFTIFVVYLVVDNKYNVYVR